MPGPIRLFAPLAVVLALAACVAAPERPSVPLAAPTPSPAAAAAQSSPEPIVLRRCDDGGDGGVLIDGICL
jgi:hypothetical protein